MNRCETCEFWRNEIDEWDQQWSECGCFVEWGLSDKNDGFEAFATATDDSGLMTRFLTGPMFGCIHHSRGQS